MKNKILISTLILLLCLAFFYSYSFANNNMMQSAGNTVKNAGNAIGNAVKNTGNALVNGTRNLANGAANLGNDMMNGMKNMTDNPTPNTLNTPNSDYTATRTSTTDGAGLFGMSGTMSTWLILGIIGAVIIGLIWYYGAQYENRNYNND